MKEFLQRMKPFLVFLGISLFLHLIVFEFNFTKLIDGGDTDYFLNPSVEMSRSLLVWRDEVLGVPEYFAVSKIGIVLPAYLLSLIIKSPSIVNFLYFSFIFSLSGYFMYLLLKYLKFQRFSLWIGSLFYMLNIYIYLRYHFPVPHLHYAYLFWPLAVLVFIRVFNRSLNFYTGVGLFSIILILISRTASTYLLYWLLIPLIALILRKGGYVKFRFEVKRFINVYMLCGALNIIVLLSYLASVINFGEFHESYLNQYYRAGSEEITREYNIFEVMAGFGQYAWVHMISEVKSGFQGYELFGVLSKAAWTVIGFVPVLLIILKNLSKKGIYFVILLLCLAVLATSFGFPFGGIYEKTLGVLPVYRDFFRDSWTYWLMPYFFVVSILLASLFKDADRFATKTKSFFDKSLILPEVAVLIFICVAAFLMYVFPAHIVNKAWMVEIPEEYYETSEYMERELSGENVLALPLTEHIYGYTYYKWGYAGPDPLRQISDVQLVDKYYNVIANEEYVEMLDGITNVSEESLKEFLGQTNTNWILLRKDLEKDYDKKKIDDWREILYNDSCFDLVDSNNYLEIYSYGCGSKDPELIEMNAQFYYGTYGCADGIPIDEYISSIDVCYETLKGPQDIFVKDGEVIWNADIDPVSLQSSYIEEDHVEWTYDGEFSINIGNGRYDLFENYDFEDEIWMEDVIETCDAESVSAEGIVKEKAGDQMHISSKYKQVCVHEEIDSENVKSKGLVKITYKSASEQPSSFCIFSKESDSCVYSGVIDTDLYSPATIGYYRTKEEGGYVSDYVFFSELAYLQGQDDLSLYVYFNSEDEERYDVLVDEIRFVSLPDVVAANVESEFDSDTDDGFEINRTFGSTGYTWENSESGVFGSDENVISFNQNYNPQWILLGWKKGSRLPEVAGDDHFVTYEYANGWLVEDSRDYDRFAVIYIPQVIYVVGLVLTVWVYGCFVGIYVGGKFVRFWKLRSSGKNCGD